jgi:hypothetical protein
VWIVAGSASARLLRNKKTEPRLHNLTGASFKYQSEPARLVRCEVRMDASSVVTKDVLPGVKDAENPVRMVQ